VATGDSGCEAYTAIAWGCGIEPRKIRYRKGRGFVFARRQHVDGEALRQLTLQDVVVFSVEELGAVGRQMEGLEAAAPSE
jgi:hypothetical protein